MSVSFEDYSFASVQIVNMMKEIEALKQRSIANDKTIVDLKQQIVSKDDVLNKCKDVITNMNNRLTAKTEELQQTTNELASRNATIAALKITIANLEAEVAASKSKANAPSSALVFQPKRKRVVTSDDSEDDLVQPPAKRAAPAAFKITFADIVTNLGGSKSSSHLKQLRAVFDAQHAKLYKDQGLDKNVIKSHHYQHFFTVMKRV